MKKNSKQQKNEARIAAQIIAEEIITNAKALGGSKARAARLEISILAVIATFGGTITHTEQPRPVTYAPSDYTQDPDTLSA